MDAETVGKEKTSGGEEVKRVELEMEAKAISFSIAEEDLKAIEEVAGKEGKNPYSIGDCYQMLAKFLKQGDRPTDGSASDKK